MDAGATRLIFDHEFYKNWRNACERQENTRGTQARHAQYLSFPSWSQKETFILIEITIDKSLGDAKNSPTCFTKVYGDFSAIKLHDYTTFNPGLARLKMSEPT